MRSKVSEAGPVTSTYVALGLCFAVPILLYSGTGGATAPSRVIPWLHVTIMFVVGLRFAALMGYKSRQLLEMVFWLFTYIFMGMAPYVQQRLDIEPSTTPGLQLEYLDPAAWAVLIGAGAVMIGSWARGLKAPGAGVKAPAVVRSRANLLTVVATGMFIYVGSRVGFTTFLASRDEYATARELAWPATAVNGLVTGGLNMSLLVAFVAQMHVREQCRQAGSRRPFLFPMLNALVLLYCVNPVSSPRYVFGTVILAVFATLGAYATVARYRFFSIAALVGMVTVFPLADIFRASTDAQFKAESPVTSLTSGDFDAFAQIVNTFDYIDAEGLQWGRQLLGVVLFWVPRSLWPDKPIDTGVVLAEHRGYYFTNLSSPLWSEFLVDWGWTGLIVGMFFVGYWFRKLDQQAETSLRTTRIPPVLVCIVPFYLLIVLRGSLLNAASYLLVIVLGSWFVTRGKRTKPARAAQGRYYPIRPLLLSRPRRRNPVGVPPLR